MRTASPASYPDDVEVAWRLAYEHWGRGYASEAATGWLDHGFGTLGLPRVIAITDPPNLRSLAVMRRLGMVFDHEAEVEDKGWSSRRRCTPSPPNSGAPPSASGG